MIFLSEGGGNVDWGLALQESYTWLSVSIVQCEFLFISLAEIVGLSG